VAAREFTEGLWRRFHGLADPNFLLEIRRDFHARFWEMYLTCALLDHAHPNGYQVSCPKPGPDILLEFQGNRIWVEAVTATNGVPGLPDTVVEPNPDGGRIPEEKLVLRYTNALREKDGKYLKYLRKGTVRKDDSFVIAINAHALAYRWTQAANDAPRFLKSLYPLGHYQVLINRQSGDIVGHQNEPRFQIVKANGAEVPVQAFLQRRSRAISAVLCSFANAASHGVPLGRDFELAYNPVARCPIATASIPSKRSWAAELTDTGGQLVGTTHIPDE